jgi:hypothetical protein
MGQGKVTNSIAELLIENGWSVLFKCVPNTIHIGVVPIPIGYGKTRYPDIVAYQNGVMKLIEIEPKLNSEICQSLKVRLEEQRTALGNRKIRSDWIRSLTMKTGVSIGIEFDIECELVVILVQKNCDFPHSRQLLNLNRIELYRDTDYEDSISN